MARTPKTPASPPPAPEPQPQWVAAGKPVNAPVRSTGLKLLLVCGLALLMCIPAVFVFALLMDRTHRAEQVAEEIGGVLGGPQTFLGPVLAVPYTYVQTTPAEGNNPARTQTVQDVRYIFPITGEATVATKSDVRRRSLFKVPVYTSDVAFAARFDLAEAGRGAPTGATFDWSRAELLVGASDPRGATSDVTLSLDGRAVAAAPALLEQQLELQVGEAPGAARRLARQSNLRLFGISAAPVAQAGATFTASGSLKFTGASRIGVLPFAKTTTVDIRGDWPHPSFDGGFLPVERRVSGSVEGDPEHGRGFTAKWSIPFVARGVPAEGDVRAVSSLGPGEVAVSFVEPANPYQSVQRSLKYALLFVGLVFLAYFMFETTTGKRVHPAQYVLVGLAQIIFYLLLLSIAEHLGFDLAFLIAAGATVALISAYAGWVFDSRRQGLRALVAFTVVYGLIYVLMRLEDYALLVGALASFAAIALVMYFTRRIDWYGGNASGNPA